MRNLLSASDLSKPQIIEVLDLAHEMSDVNEREIKKLPTLRGKTVVNLFFEDSTRTRISFELAAKRLSADVINFAAITIAQPRLLTSRVPTRFFVAASAPRACPPSRSPNHGLPASALANAELHDTNRPGTPPFALGFGKKILNSEIRVGFRTTFVPKEYKDELKPTRISGLPENQ